MRDNIYYIDVQFFTAGTRVQLCQCDIICIAKVEAYYRLVVDTSSSIANESSVVEKNEKTYSYCMYSI